MKNLNSKTRQFIAIAITLLAFIFFYHKSMEVLVLATWCVYSSANLILDGIIIFRNSAKEVEKFAEAEDSSNTFVFLFIIFSAFFSLFAVLQLLLSVKHNAPDFNSQTLLSVFSVISSWFLIHTVFTLRYAHLFYNGLKKGKEKGICFPGGDDPDLTDFAYFSFTVGMTFQVSDVEVAARDIRKLVLLQGILSFAFNTAIIALSINIISSLLSK
jgi:uncharacterized membrane protein